MLKVGTAATKVYVTVRTTEGSWFGPQPMTFKTNGEVEAPGTVNDADTLPKAATPSRVRAVPVAQVNGVAPVVKRSVVPVKSESVETLIVLTWSVPLAF